MEMKFPFRHFQIIDRLKASIADGSLLIDDPCSIYFKRHIMEPRFYLFHFSNPIAFLLCILLRLIFHNQIHPLPPFLLPAHTKIFLHFVHRYVKSGTNIHISSSRFSILISCEDHLLIYRIKNSICSSKVCFNSCSSPTGSIPHERFSYSDTASSVFSSHRNNSGTKSARHFSRHATHDTLHNLCRYN